MNEFEKKLLLTQREYDILNSLSGKYSEPFTQVNYYFDTDDFSMNKKGITCRIRLKDGTYTPTIKKHNNKLIYCSLESNLEKKQRLDTEAFTFLGASLQGDLITERTILYKDSCFEIVIDRNSYLGVTDYELEVEYVEEYHNWIDRLVKATLVRLYPDKIELIMSILSRLGVDTKSKSARFFEQKLSQKR